jgi:threonylcarbamoyladenosine tRNA methylthiotransferase MtaB
MPQVPKPVRKERAARLRALGQARYKALFKSRIGVTESVLVERGGVGRTEHFLPVAVPGHAAGQIVPVVVTGVDGDTLAGEVLRKAA